MIGHSQDLSVLLMQAVYLPVALFTVIGVSQITCNCGGLDFAWCFSWSGTSHNVPTKSCREKVNLKKNKRLLEVNFIGKRNKSVPF